MSQKVLIGISTEDFQVIMFVFWNVIFHFNTFFPALIAITGNISAW